MGSTAGLFRKFPLARLTPTDMKSFREFAVLALAVSFSAVSIVAQQGQAPVVADVNVSADDLLAQPPGANWTSYNGDDTGRRTDRIEIHGKDLAGRDGGGAASEIGFQ